MWKRIRKKVSSHAKYPANFKDFLRDSSNKQELFEFITSKISSSDFPTDKTIYVTSSYSNIIMTLCIHVFCINSITIANLLYTGSSVISKRSCQTINHAIEPCDHEDADSRIVLHLYNAMKSGARNIVVRTVDSDVLVVFVGLFSHFHSDTNIWVAFGTGKFFRYYHINTINQVLVSVRSKDLLFFHSFTGSDTTSQFLGKGKKNSMGCWKAYPEATTAFMNVTEQPFHPLVDNTILLPKRASEQGNVIGLVSVYIYYIYIYKVVIKKKL